MIQRKDESREHYLPRLYDYSERVWHQYHLAQTEDLDFCFKSAHYRDDDQYTLSPSRIQPRTRATLQLVRHMAAQISRNELYLDVRPVDDQLDVPLAEAWENLLKHEFYHPQKRYPDIRDMVALGALGARMWGCEAYYNPVVREILFRELDGRNVTWAPGYRSAHDPECPWVGIRDRLTVADCKNRGWDNVNDLRGDSEFDERGLASPSWPKLDDGGDEWVTVWRLWERFPMDTREREKETRKLHPDERYMLCMSCREYRTPRQQEASVKYPEVSRFVDAVNDKPGGCPLCGGDLHRIDMEKVTEEVLAYPNGRFSISAPKQGKTFDERPWGKLRTVPMFVFQAFPHPDIMEVMGQSVTSEHRTLQLADDMVTRFGLEHLMLAKPYWAIPNQHVFDFRGEEWFFGDHQGNGIYYDVNALGQGGGISPIQAAGLPQGWQTVDQAIQNKFQSHTGSNDFALGQNQTRDIPVGTIEAMERIQEIPVLHMAERFRRDETPFVGSVVDLIRMHYTDRRYVDILGPLGQHFAQMIRGSDMPNVNVLVTASPARAQVEEREVRALDVLATRPRHIRKFIAKSLNIPESALRALEDDEAEMMAGAGGAVPANGGEGTAAPPAQPMGAMQ